MRKIKPSIVRIDKNVVSGTKKFTSLASDPGAWRGETLGTRLEPPLYEFPTPTPPLQVVKGNRGVYIHEEDIDGFSDIKSSSSSSNHGVLPVLPVSFCPFVNFSSTPHEICSHTVVAS